LALSQAPERVEGQKDLEPPGFATHVLALAKHQACRGGGFMI
jgi:hypothetical protein